MGARFETVRLQLQSTACAPYGISIGRLLSTAWRQMGSAAFTGRRGIRARPIGATWQGHLPKDFNPRRCAPNRDVLKVRNWTDPYTAILYAPCYERPSGELKAGFLFTLKFDSAGNWKIVKTHQMSKKELEEEQ
jgi:hypothetical protein